MKPRRSFYYKFYVVRAILVCLLALTLLVSGCVTKKPKVFRVGVLSGMSFAADVTNGFKAGMAELGYVDGQDITYDVQETEFDMAVYRSVLSKFVADKVDLILAFPTEAAIEAASVTEGTGIPMVFNYTVIEGSNLVDNVREPGGNVTGVRYPAPDIGVKRFEILRAIAPTAKRIWIPYQRGYPSVPVQLELLRPMAEAAGMTLIEFPAESVEELEAELGARSQQDDLGLDAILFLAEPLAVTPPFFVVIGKFAYEHMIPVGGAYISVDSYESIFGVISSPFESGKLAAPIADKILKGMPAGTIPVVSPENFVQISYKAAQALGVTVPESLLVQADEIIR